MKALLSIARPFSVSVAVLLGLVLSGCGRTWYLAGYEREINSGTRAIEAAHDDAQRAAAYTQRARGYSEKARYSRAFNLIPLEEYNRLFGLAIKDHDQAIALAPTSAEAYYNRGQTYYTRAILEVVVNGLLVGTEAERKAWFAPAIADLTKATERDGRHYMAWDVLGLSHETAGEIDQAISDYTHEMALNSLGKSRLADAYCTRGGVKAGDKNDAAAIADYEKSIELGATDDGCSCDPYSPLMALYQKDRRYDQVWVVVHRAWAAKKWIAPDFLETVKRESGRQN